MADNWSASFMCRIIVVGKATTRKQHEFRGSKCYERCAWAVSVLIAHLNAPSSAKERKTNAKTETRVRSYIHITSYLLFHISPLNLFLLLLNNLPPCLPLLFIIQLWHSYSLDPHPSSPPPSLPAFSVPLSSPTHLEHLPTIAVLRWWWPFVTTNPVHNSK